MKALIVSTTLVATIGVCLTLGIGLGYATVTGILRAFGHKPPKPATSPALNAVHVGMD